jgi:hypothetical protein
VIGGLIFAGRRAFGVQRKQAVDGGWRHVR